MSLFVAYEVHGGEKSFGGGKPYEQYKSSNFGLVQKRLKIHEIIAFLC